jgi:hypothetical protein
MVARVPSRQAIRLVAGPCAEVATMRDARYAELRQSLCDAICNGCVSVGGPDCSGERWRIGRRRRLKPSSLGDLMERTDLGVECSLRSRQASTAGGSASDPGRSVVRGRTGAETGFVRDEPAGREHAADAVAVGGAMRATCVGDTACSQATKARATRPRASSAARSSQTSSRAATTPGPPMAGERHVGTTRGQSAPRRIQVGC